MDIHEYQGKRLLQQFKVPVPIGDVAYNTHEALRIARWLEEDVMVVKAQVRAGGRGKAGGIKLTRSVQEVVTAADAMFGVYLKTPQTPPQGLQIRRVYIEAGCDIDREFYACVLINRKTGGNDVIVSTAGGMDIEAAAAASPDAMESVSLPPGETMQMHHARMLCYKLGLRGKSGRRAQRALLNIYRAYDTLDATLIEVNPLVVTKGGEVMALDCKASFDDNALYRQRWAEEMRDDDDADPLELEAAQHNLNYVKLKGNIGIMVNGAGLSMATMDIISYMGGAAANFMDVAGAATPERVAAAFKLIYRDQDVKGILLNIFGGMMRCNSIAEGLVSAAREVGLSKPLVVRLEGTNVELGRKILNDSKLPINPVTTMEEAARRIVDAVREAS